MDSIPNPSLMTRLRRNRLWVASGGAVAVAAGVVGFWTIESGTGHAVARPEKVAADTDGAFRPSETQWSGLKLAPVRQVAFRDERATDGKIAINEDTTTPVFSPYSGRVSRLIAKPGDFVEPGAPLFAIEASEYVQGQNDLVTAVASLEKAKSRLILSQTIEKRQRDLLAIRGGSLKDLEQAQSDLIQAQGDQRKVGLGQYINVGASDPVYTVGDLATVWLIANVRESDAPKMKVGAPVEVSVLAYPGRAFNARLSYVAPALDSNTRRLPVRAQIDNAGREFLPEMFASFRIITGEGRLAPAVPIEAIVYEGANARVWVANPEAKTVSTRPIEVGMTTNGQVEVRKGLSVGETVVASGTLFIDRAAIRD
jgi:cobalt-zinc-cadmium efflux system membrane fusion protein